MLKPILPCLIIILCNSSCSSNGIHRQSSNGQLSSNTKRTKPTSKWQPAYKQRQIQNSTNALVTRGLFQKGCPYTADSLSDHAPVINKKMNYGTWNITQFANPKKLERVKTDGTKIQFYIHKFKFFNRGDGGVWTGETRLDYTRRLTHIGTQLKSLMRANKMPAFALQEVPIGQNRRSLNAALNPEYSIQYAKKKNDTAVIYPSKNRGEFFEHRARMQIYCFKKACYGSAHLTFPNDQDQTIANCNALMEVKARAQSKGYQTLQIAGDMNASAQTYRADCKDVPGFLTAKIHTYRGQGQSCSDNHGSQPKANIDLIFEWNLQD